MRRKIQSRRIGVFREASQGARNRACTLVPGADLVPFMGISNFSPQVDGDGRLNTARPRFQVHWRAASLRAHAHCTLLCQCRRVSNVWLVLIVINQHLCEAKQRTYRPCESRAW